MEKFMKTTSCGDRILEKSAALRNSVSAFLLSAYCALFAAIPAFAEGGKSGLTGISGALETGLTDGVTQLWGVLKAISIPIAVVALAICAIKILWGGQRAAEEAKSLAIKIVIAIALVMLAPSIVALIVGWFSGASKNSLSEMQNAIQSVK